MSRKQDKSQGVSRRAFLKTMGLGGVAAAGLATVGGPALAQSPTIPKRTLGKTGVEVPILALGGMFDTINNQLLLKQAVSWGVTYWDTAEGYGNGLSEEGFARYFSRNPDARKDIFLVTKLTPKGGDLSGRLDKCLQRLKTDHVDLFFIHGISAIDEMSEDIRSWAEAMKKAGKFKFVGFSTHTNMEDCLLGAVKKPWIDAIMFSYNFRLMHEAKMQEAMAACTAANIGLVAMKTQGGGQVRSDSPAEAAMAGRFLDKGFTDKQAKLKAVWEDKRIASICSQMHNLTILAANVAASRDLTALAAADHEALRMFAAETCQDYCAGCGSVCGAALGGLVPVSDVMRCLMYYHDYGDRDLARQVFASLPAEVRARLPELDYTDAEQACPRRLAIAAHMRQAMELLA